MFVMLSFYPRLISRRSYVTVSGKAFRPRLMDVGDLRWVLFTVCAAYVLLSVVLPMLTLVYASVQKWPPPSPPVQLHARSLPDRNVAERGPVCDDEQHHAGFVTATIASRC